MREKVNPFIKFCATRTVPSTVALAACAHGVMVFARHLGYFIVHPDSQPLPGLGTVWTTSSCARTFQPSARTCKNHATVTQTPTQLIRRSLNLTSCRTARYSVNPNSQKSGFFTFPNLSKSRLCSFLINIY
jgi:hypothetical protein